ncbi:MAG: hypothetical protein WBQ86_00355 [Candidatus Binatus sp.]
MDAFSLEELVGLIVSDVAPVHDYLQIAFENGSGLNINNRFEIDGGDTSTLGWIKGQRLVSVRDTLTTIDFTFSSGTTIRVGMTESDFCDPEAMEYHGADGNIVVWREESIKRPAG